MSDSKPRWKTIPDIGDAARALATSKQFVNRDRRVPMRSNNKLADAQASLWRNGFVSGGEIVARDW